MIFGNIKNRLVRFALFGVMLLAPMLSYSVFMLKIGMHSSTDRAYFWVGLMMASPLYLGWIFLCVIVNRIGNQRHEEE